MNELNFIKSQAVSPKIHYNSIQNQVLTFSLPILALFIFSSSIKYYKKCYKRPKALNSKKIKSGILKQYFPINSFSDQKIHYAKVKNLQPDILGSRQANALGLSTVTKGNQTAKLSKEDWIEAWRTVPNSKPETVLLDSVCDNPSTLKWLNIRELEQLATEVREDMLWSVSQTGGHLGSGLGVVDLTVALHHIYDSPKDKIIWDVSHQTYPHKILTGRRNRMTEMRKLDGLSGFCKRSESEHDAFGAGHSGTSVSAATGFAAGRDLLNGDEHIVTVIGDGAITGGQAFEGLNHAGYLNLKKFVVILNDNSEVSLPTNYKTPSGTRVSEPVGALTSVLGKIRSKLGNKASTLLTNIQFQEVRSLARDMLETVPDELRSAIGKIDEYARSIMSSDSHMSFFEDMGFYFIPAVDGHDMRLLVKILGNIKKMQEAGKLNKPVFIHVCTKKGCGYSDAEEALDKMHGVSKFNIKVNRKSEITSKPEVKKTQNMINSEKRSILSKVSKANHQSSTKSISTLGLGKFGNTTFSRKSRVLKAKASKAEYPPYLKDLSSDSHVFGRTLNIIANEDPKVVAITAAMPGGTGLTEFENLNRIYDVGIAEQHAVTFAAGLACQGIKPFCAIYSTFLQRGYDQVMHDVALQKLPVRFIIDRAGLVGQDGPTHAGAYDVTFLNCLPNMLLCASSTSEELVNLVYTLWQIDDQPSALRFARGGGGKKELTPPTLAQEPGRFLEPGVGRVVKDGSKIAILSYGGLLKNCLNGANLMKERHDISVTVADARWCKPFDKKLVDELLSTHEIVLTVEDNSIGGFGSVILDYLARNHTTNRRGIVYPMYLPDKYIPHGTQEQQYQLAGLDEESIYSTMVKLLKL